MTREKTTGMFEWFKAMSDEVRTDFMKVTLGTAVRSDIDGDNVMGFREALEAGPGASSFVGSAAANMPRVNTGFDASLGHVVEQEKKTSSPKGNVFSCIFDVRAQDGGINAAGSVMVLIKRNKTPLIFRAFDKLESGNAMFQSGVVVDLLKGRGGRGLHGGVPENNNSLILSFPGGVLAVTSEAGVMKVYISEIPVFLVPDGLTEGKISQFRPSPEEGVRAVLSSGQMFFVLSFKNPTTYEVNTVKRAPIKIALLKVTKNLAFFGLGIAGLTEKLWMAAPFAAAIQPPESRSLSQLDSDGKLHVLVVLIDSETNIIKAVRPIAVPRNVSFAIDDVMAEQLGVADHYGEERYAREIVAGESMWSDLDTLPTNMLVADGMCDG